VIEMVFGWNLEVPWAETRDLSGWNRSWAAHTAAACDCCSTFRYSTVDPTDASSGAASPRWSISRCGVFLAAGEIKAEAYRVSRLGPIQVGRPGQRVCRAVIRSRHGGAGARRNR
jgi:hypothetical protein